MEFGMRHANNEKREMTCNGWNGTIRKFGVKETYKYSRILEDDTIQKVEIKEKITKEYLRRTRKLLKIKICSRTLIKGINT